MIITTSKDDLFQTIQTVQGAVNTKGGLPILANILLEAQNDSLKLTTTNLDIAISREIPVKVEEEGAITLPAKRFSEIIRESNSGQALRIMVKKNLSVVIETGKTVFKLMGTTSTDFPNVPVLEEGEFISIPQPLLSEMIRLTAFAVSRDETRYVLNGILFAFHDKSLRLVATDGRRLAMIEKQFKKPFGITRNIIIPNKTIQELSRNLDEDGEVGLGTRENQLQFKINQTIITSRLIDGEFPNYEQVIPKETKEQIRVNTQQFLSATRRACIFTSQESQSVKIDLTRNRMVISKNTPEIGEFREEIEADYSGDEFSIGFNPNYLIDVLKNISEENIQFGLTDPEKPGMIKSQQDYTYIVLPMQLS